MLKQFLYTKKQYINKQTILTDKKNRLNFERRILSKELAKFYKEFENNEQLTPHMLN